MSKDTDFINEERNYFGKIYTDITYAISEISPFIDESNLKKRKYYNKSHTLQNYIKLLDSAEYECKKKSIFSMFKSNPSINLLKDFKLQNKESFKQLEKCCNCQCLNCAFECNFNGCSSCRHDSILCYCDKEKVNVRKFDDFTLDLTNNDNNISSKYKVLAILEDCTLNQLYIIAQNINNFDDKLVLYYYPRIKEDSYGEITNVDEFDFIVETYQNS